MREEVKMTMRRVLPRCLRKMRQFKTEGEDERTLRLKIIKYFGENDIPDTEEIVSYLKSHRVGVFNYYWADKHIYTVNRIKLDKSNGLYFTVLYGRRMYFKRGMNLEKCNTYLNSLLLEQDDYSPHNYLTKQELECFEARTVVDCGAAEGIFALSVCGKAKEIVLFEADEGWIEALNYTFQNVENVKIVPKFIGAESNGNMMTLDDYFHDRTDVDLIKMDIENMECDAIKGAKNVLENNPQLQLEVCVYHSQDEECRVCDLMKGYSKNIKPGYMMFIYDTEGLQEPYIRHGVIRFKK